MDKVNVREVFKQKNPKVAKLIPGFLFRYIERIIHQKEINELLPKINHLYGLDYAKGIIEHFDLKVQVKGKELIPTEGRNIFVANHPLGGLDGIKFIKSENIGALRMTEKFLKEDPICEEEFEDMYKFISETINKTLEKLNGKDIKSIVGIGGTITSVSAINQKLEVYSMDKIHSSEIYQKELDIILQNLKKMTLNDKKNIKGLQAKRADIITAGVTILNIIMKKLEKQNIIVSEYDNLEGLLCQKVKKMS